MGKAIRLEDGTRISRVSAGLYADSSKKYYYAKERVGRSLNLYNRAVLKLYEQNNIVPIRMTRGKITISVITEEQYNIIKEVHENKSRC